MSPSLVLAMDIKGGERAAPLRHLQLLDPLGPLPALVVVVDGEDPETPLRLPDAPLPPGCVTVGPYHRLGRVWRLEIIGHGPAGGHGGGQTGELPTWSRGSCGPPAASVPPGPSAW